MKVKEKLTGLAIGLINSLLGSGGGMITVPFLKSKGLDQQSAQATSTAVILPLSLISTILYLRQGAFNISDGIIFIPAGVIGAVIGGLTLKKIPSKLLKYVFSTFMIWAGIRMILK